MTRAQQIAAVAICGKCQLPIHESEGGLRHFGWFTAPDLLEALHHAHTFVSLELENRRAGMSDEKDEYISDAVNLLDKITTAIRRAQGKP